MSLIGRIIHAAGKPGGRGETGRTDTSTTSPCREISRDGVSAKDGIIAAVGKKTWPLTHALVSNDTALVSYSHLYINKVCEVYQPALVQISSVVI